MSQAAPSLRSRPDRQRIDARPQRGDLTFGAALGRLQFGDPLVGQSQRGDRPVVVFVEPDLALVELTDPALHGLELRLGLLGAGRGLLDALRQLGHAIVDRLDAGSHRLDLAGQPGQALAAVGLGLHRRDVGPFGLGGGALAFGQLRAGRLQPGAGALELGEQLLLGGGHLLGLGLQLVGVGTAGRGGFDVQVLGALAGDAYRRADSFGQGRQPKPGLLSGFRALRQRRQRGLVRGQFLGGHRHPCRRLVVLAAQRRLGVVGVVELGLPDDHVVGGQPQPGVAQVGLDGLGATGHLRLAAKGFELAAQLGGQIGQPGQVRRHRLELADRLLLALAVLEHTGRFLDERATVLGPRFQDLVELALTDDDVHLAADAGVAQQFLHVHQTAIAAVDFVFAGAVAEHPTGDRHLGVLDRQRVVGVVDRDGDLGAAQRRARRRAREDDVFHLAAAQRLGALLPHHPGERVDDIGLARAIRADHRGDPGLEPQSRRRGEGLEALQRQTLEVHGEPDYRSEKPLMASPRGDQSTTTVSTWPGVFPPCNRRNSCSQASREPCATTCTRPSGRLAA